MSLYDQHADLYDLAFSGDVGPEVEWLFKKPGTDIHVILKSGCGSGRMFPVSAD